ncbi:hypothetical protein CC1G_15402 [Coprinopsis cinerea okayama7|uniref:Uncharacterized protein n=1 Tax=Coprinopsis cinerea (strain Okayama-7 / 130 / ATCC MYA-4618 / FGSC 9003) TaxID=240176 RepID=D6RQL7_COPC7|nr:hypothetical protein CC1G_15402 [Coprinopsis cinerea okayama7\|eukprot:XP_002910124.1 hypothetical protein CC1G_15402 [Coprinopsis cinerea okayama7\
MAVLDVFGLVLKGGRRVRQPLTRTRTRSLPRTRNPPGIENPCPSLDVFSSLSGRWGAQAERCNDSHRKKNHPSAAYSFFDHPTNSLRQRAWLVFSVGGLVRYAALRKVTMNARGALASFTSGREFGNWWCQGRSPVDAFAFILPKMMVPSLKTLVLETRYHRPALFAAIVHEDSDWETLDFVSCRVTMVQD